MHTHTKTKPKQPSSGWVHTGNKLPLGFAVSLRKPLGRADSFHAAPSPIKHNGAEAAGGNASSCTNLSHDWPRAQEAQSSCCLATRTRVGYWTRQTHSMKAFFWFWLYINSSGVDSNTHTQCVCVLTATHTHCQFIHTHIHIYMHTCTVSILLEREARANHPAWEVKAPRAPITIGNNDVFRPHTFSNWSVFCLMVPSPRIATSFTAVLFSSLTTTV